MTCGTLCFSPGVLCTRCTKEDSHLRGLWSTAASNIGCETQENLDREEDRGEAWLSEPIGFLLALDLPL